MTEFLIYQAKAAAILAVFYMFYRLLLSRETFHRLNRVVLLGTAILSFILPLCVITVTKTVRVPALPSPGAVSEVALSETAAGSPEWWQSALVVLYAGGAFAMLVSVLVSVMRIRKIIGSGERHRLESGETMVITELDTQPFSWMNYIVLNREDSKNEEIITHEKAHIALGHSWDLLIADMITAMQWFNPAIWMLRADLRALHEYEADDAVLKSGADIKKYQYLLIRKAVGKSGYSVANSFNHSTLKQRITMMLNKKSTKRSAWKALYIIPLAGISLVAGARTSVEYICDSPVADEPVKVTAVTSISKTTDTMSVKYTKLLVKTDTFKVTYVLNANDLDSLKSINPEQIKSIRVYKDGETGDGKLIVVQADEKGATDTKHDVTLKIMGSGDEYKGVLIIDGQDADANSKNGKNDKKDQDSVLYIVDGKSMNDISSISPGNIASVVVHKDPETLKTYNAEGKKGVVIITTKKPE